MRGNSLAAALLAVLLGDEDTRAAITEQALVEMDRGVINPAKAWQEEHDDTKPLHFGPAAKEYVEKTFARGGGEGMVLAMLEKVLRRDREIKVLMDRPAGSPSDLDWAAVRAERDNISAKATRLERQLRDARIDRDRQADVARSLETALREAHANLAEATARIRTQEDTILRMDQDLSEAHGLRQALEEKVAEIKVDDDPRIKENW